jgi:hypothetical protein
MTTTPTSTNPWTELLYGPEQLWRYFPDIDDATEEELDAELPERTPEEIAAYWQAEREREARLQYAEPIGPEPYWPPLDEEEEEAERYDTWAWEASQTSLWGLFGEFDPLDPDTDPDEMAFAQEYMLECIFQDDNPLIVEKCMWEYADLAYGLARHKLPPIADLVGKDNPWIEVKDGDLRALNCFRRHYSCRPGKQSKLFVGPGYKMVLIIPHPKDPLDAAALFVWRLEKFRRDDNWGINCAVFRNESGLLASDLIRYAVLFAQTRWPFIPRFFTHVDPNRTRPIYQRGKRIYGYSYIKAGWRMHSRTDDGLITLAKVEIPPGFWLPWDPKHAQLQRQPDDYFPHITETLAERNQPDIIPAHIIPPNAGGAPPEYEDRKAYKKTKKAPAARKELPPLPPPQPPQRVQLHLFGD